MSRARAPVCTSPFARYRARAESVAPASNADGIDGISRVISRVIPSCLSIAGELISLMRLFHYFSSDAFATLAPGKPRIGAQHTLLCTP